MKTIVYYENGNKYIGCEEYNKHQLRIFKEMAIENNHIGYLKGHRIWNNNLDNVICYFLYKPDHAEITRRRLNGFKFATWHKL